MKIRLINRKIPKKNKNNKTLKKTLLGVFLIGFYWFFFWWVFIGWVFMPTLDTPMANCKRTEDINKSHEQQGRIPEFVQERGGGGG